MTVAASFLSEVHKDDASQEDLICRKRWVILGTSVFRNRIDTLPPEHNRVLNVDTLLFSMLGQFGKYKYLGDVIRPSAYRQHAGGIWGSLDDVSKAKNVAMTSLWISSYYQRLSQPSFARWYRRRFYDNVRQAVAVLVRDKRKRDVPALAHGIAVQVVTPFGWAGLRRFVLVWSAFLVEGARGIFTEYRRLLKRKARAVKRKVPALFARS